MHRGHSFIQNNSTRGGFTLIELLVTSAVMLILFGGIYLSYASILDSLTNASVRNAAVSVMNRQIEIDRNLPYASVGTIGGVPSGVIPASQTTTQSGIPFTIQNIIRNIDDPFDGTLGGSPNDTAPADYKLVEVQVTCPTCTRFVPVAMTTTIAPKNLESASSSGSLFVRTFDASAQPISGVTVRVVNNSTTPTIDLTDITNTDGMLQLVGVPTSTQSYQIWVSKSGYSSDRSYPLGGASNPNPLTPHATIAASTLTQVSFAIDKVTTLSVHTSDDRCVASPSKTFSITGTKIIGTSPDVIKFSTSSVTNASGIKTFSDIEWDTYAIAFTDSSVALAGTSPVSPLTIIPSSTVDFRFLVKPANPRALLVHVLNQGGTQIQNATVTLSKVGFSETLVTGKSTYTDSSWSGGAYASQSGTDVDGTPGSVTLVGFPYSTSTSAWLISNTIDFGGASTVLHTFMWNPTSQAGGTTLAFQVAGNNDNATWNFVGPDGTGGTYFTNPLGEAIPSVLNGNRYVRYKAYLSTTDENATPQLDNVTFQFTGPCVAPGEAYFEGLSGGAYTLAVSAPGYLATTTSVSAGSNWQETSVILSP